MEENMIKDGLGMQREELQMLQYEEQIIWKSVRSKEIKEDLEKLYEKLLKKYYICK